MILALGIRMSLSGANLFPDKKDEFVAAGRESVPAWLLPSEQEKQEAIASNSKVRLNANAEMAAAAARSQPTSKRRRTTTSHYFEPDGKPKPLMLPPWALVGNLHL